MSFGDRACASCRTRDGSSPLQRCARCKSVFYCDIECQTKHWKSHKKECRALAAAAAADLARRDEIPRCRHRVVDVHVTCREPANLIRCDAESRRALEGTPDGDRLARLTADGILGYCMVVSDRIVSPPPADSDLPCKSRVYIWDELYVTDKGSYDGKEVCSVIVHHLRAIRDQNTDPNLEVRLFIHGDLPGVAQDLLLCADVLSTPSNQGKFRCNLDGPIFRKIDVFSGKECVTNKYTKARGANNYVSHEQDPINPATITLDAINRVENNPPQMVMGNEFRTAMYTGGTFPGRDILNRSPLPKGPDYVSKLVSSVVQCAEISSIGQLIEQAVPFNDVGAMYGRLVMAGVLDGGEGLFRES